MPTVSDEISSRSLVLGMVRPDGSLDGGELYQVADACGFTVHQIRLTLARLVREGVLTQEGRGRKAVFGLTDAGHAVVDPEVGFLEMAFDQDAGRAPWDGVWHLVSFTIAEEQRNARRELREELQRFAAGISTAGGLHVSPHAWEPWLLPTIARLGLDSSVAFAAATSLRLGGTSDPAKVAAQLWPLEDVATLWRRFLRTHTAAVAVLVDGEEGDPVQRLAAAVRVIVDFDAIMHVDPLLPAELLPARWPGAEGRALLAEAATAIRRARVGSGLPGLFSRFDSAVPARPSGRRR